MTSAICRSRGRVVALPRDEPRRNRRQLRRDATGARFGRARRERVRIADRIAGGERGRQRRAHRGLRAIDGDADLGVIAARGERRNHPDRDRQPSACHVANVTGLRSFRHLDRPRGISSDQLAGAVRIAALEPGACRRGAARSARRRASAPCHRRAPLQRKSHPRGPPRCTCRRRRSSAARRRRRDSRGSRSSRVRPRAAWHRRRCCSARSRRRRRRPR